MLGRRVLPEVVTATRELDPSTLRGGDGAINLARISAVAPTLVQADNAMSQATAAVAARPTSTWLGPVDSARGDLLTQMRALGKTLHSATLASQIAPPMLGADGTKRYFVSFQNDAEARGTGGLPGAFGIVRASHGKISVERFESDGALGGVKSGLNFGTAYNRLWSVGAPYDEYVDSNVSRALPLRRPHLAGHVAEQDPREARRRPGRRPAGARLPARCHRAGDAARPLDRVGRPTSSN